MNNALIWFWALLIFASIAWYAALLFYVGFKGGRDIFNMGRDLMGRPSDEHSATEDR